MFHQKYFSIFFLAFNAGLFSIAISAEVKTDPAFEKKVFLGKEGTLPYRILFPYEFNKKQKYPLILVLHGAGERGSDNELQLTHGSGLFLEEKVRKKFPAIVVFPQCPAESYWSNLHRTEESDGKRSYEFRPDGEPTKAMTILLELIDSMAGQSFVDRQRLYAGGLSMGGMGTFELLWRRPELFAAAFPICGGGHPDTVNKYAGKVSLWIFHGAKDDIVPPHHSEKMVKALRDGGADVRFTLYPDVNHNSWDNAFAEPELLPWLFSQKKGS